MKIHDRMPVILDDAEALAWMGNEPLPPGRVQQLCQPLPFDRMQCWPVTPRMNKVSYEAPDVIEPITVTPRAVQGDLFGN